MKRPSNFDFLRETWPLAYRNAVEAERLARTSPAAAPNRARAAFEAGHLRFRGLKMDTPYEAWPPLASFVGELRRALGEKDQAYRAAESLYEATNEESHLKVEPTTEVEAVDIIQDLFIVLRRLYVWRRAGPAAPIPEFDPALVPSASLQRQRENLDDGTHSAATLATLCVGREPRARAAAAAAVLEALTEQFATLAERHTL